MPLKFHQTAPRLSQAASGAALPAAAAVGVLALTVPAGGTANLDWTATAGQKLRVLGVWALKTSTAGAAGDTLQLQDGAGNNISEALNMNVADLAIVRSLTRDDARHDVPAGTGLRVRRVDGGLTGNSAIVYVKVALFP